MTVRLWLNAHYILSDNVKNSVHLLLNTQIYMSYVTHFFWTIFNQIFLFSLKSNYFNEAEVIQTESKCALFIEKVLIVS